MRSVTLRTMRFLLSSFSSHYLPSLSLAVLLASGCATPPRAPGSVQQEQDEGDGDDDDSYGDGDSSYGDGDYSYGDGDGDTSSGDGDFFEGSHDGGTSTGGDTDFGAILCGLIGGCNGGVMPPAPSDGGTSASGDDSIVKGREPDPNNPPECPKHAPDNPVGSCIGLPIYVTCGYTSYHCICDWYHWLCI